MRSLCILVHGYATGTAHRHALQDDKLTLAGDLEMNRKTTGGSRLPSVPPENPTAPVRRTSTSAQFVHSGARLCDRDCAQACTSGSHNRHSRPSDDEREDHGRLKVVASATQRGSRFLLRLIYSESAGMSVSCSQAAISIARAVLPEARTGRPFCQPRPAAWDKGPTK